MPILAKKIIFSDEAHFDLGGYVNKKNCRIWGTENPHAYIASLFGANFFKAFSKKKGIWRTLYFYSDDKALRSTYIVCP